MDLPLSVIYCIIMYVYAHGTDVVLQSNTDVNKNTILLVLG